MSRRESQFMQITLIICVLLLLGLGTAVFMLSGSIKTANDERDQAEQKFQNAQTEKNQLFAKVELLKSQIGVSTNTEAQLKEVMTPLTSGSAELQAEVKELQAAYNRDMENFEADYTGARDYPKLVAKLKEAIIKRNVVNAEYKVTEQKTIKQREDAEQALAAANAAMARLKDDHKSALDAKDLAFDTARRAYEALSSKIQEQLKGEYQKYKIIELAKKKEADDFVGKIALLDGTITDQKKTISEIKEGGDPSVFESPDGIITSVSQRTSRAYINIGLADGLRRQQTFSIFDRGEGNITQAKPKGTIKVIQITGSHSAVATITSDDISNPILRGDLIYSSVWKAGRSVTFALLGFLDVNGNGKSDRQIIHNLITSNGGTIVAELDDDGKRTGKLTPHTRFLVMGAKPNENSSAAVISEYGKMDQEAERNGIDRISLDKLLDYMGYKGGGANTVRLGKRADSDDFKTKRDPLAPKSSGDTFRSRTPPTRGKNGAF